MGIFESNLVSPRSLVMLSLLLLLAPLATAIDVLPISGRDAFASCVKDDAVWLINLVHSKCTSCDVFGDEFTTTGSKYSNDFFFGELDLSDPANDFVYEFWQLDWMDLPAVAALIDDWDNPLEEPEILESDDEGTPITAEEFSEWLEEDVIDELREETNMARTQMGFLMKMKNSHP